MRRHVCLFILTSWTRVDHAGVLHSGSCPQSFSRFLHSGRPLNCEPFGVTILPVDDAPLLSPERWLLAQAIIRRSLAGDWPRWIILRTDLLLSEAIRPIFCGDPEQWFLHFTPFISDLAMTCLFPRIPLVFHLEPLDSRPKAFRIYTPTI